MSLFIMSLIMLENKPLHPATLLYGLFSMILFFSVLNLFGIYKPVDEAYVLISIMLGSFGLGSFFGSFAKSKIAIRSSDGIKGKKHYLNIKIFYLLTGIAILFLLYDTLISLKYILEGIPAWQVRNWTLEEFGSQNPILSRRSFGEELFRTVVLSPMGMVIPPVAAYVFFDSYYKKHRNMVLALALMHVLMVCVSSGGGRLRMIYFCGCFFIAYLVFSNKKLFPDFKRNIYRRKTLIFGSVFVVGVILMTWFRVGIGYLWRQIYTYFALPPTLLSIWLPSIKEAEPTYGMLSFYGVFGYFFRALKMLGMNALVPSVYDNAFQHILDAQAFRDTGYGIGNAFVTPIYYFYLDGGKLFICLASVVFGVITARIHKNVSKKVDIRSFSIYALMMYGVFEAFMTIMTGVPAQIIAIIFVFLICGKTKTGGH